RRQVRHGEESAVVVRMRVDESRCDDAVGGVDLARAGRAGKVADGDDAVPGDADVAATARGPGAVDHEPVPDHELDVGHPADPPSGGWWACQCRASSRRWQIQTRSWRKTSSTKRASAAARAGLPASRQWTATVISFGASAPSR